MKKLALISMLLSVAGLAAAAPQQIHGAQEPAAAAEPEQAPVLTVDHLNATLWTQTAAEYETAALQAYELAGVMLEWALREPTWTASLEQLEAGGHEALPPAVILDVDETVLDNSAYQARLLLEDEEFATASWNDWVREARAEPVPGALEFTRAAADRGVTVFYVTNRNHVVEEPTRENLEAAGFPLRDDIDVLLTRDELPDWGSDKGTRRAAVAAEFRVLLLVGDNLGDFLDGVRTDPETRSAMVREHADWWGRRWIVLPNPQYGSWEGALIGFEYGLERSEKRRRKLEALEAKREQR